MDRKARSGWMTFVTVAFAVALVIAIYMIIFTTGQPEGEQPSPHAIQQSN
ncbi:hypothetical protein LH464_14695 [Neorhizobium sp. T786]|nr:hypothetical protein [Neorhizobium xiangyangii]MCB5203725.1 hypothetical protein [Neorhizobium xiangyangii]